MQKGKGGFVVSDEVGGGGFRGQFRIGGVHLAPHSSVDFLLGQFTISIGIRLHQPCIMFSFDLLIYHLHLEPVCEKVWGREA